jgi:hypothetical protein
MRDDAGTAAVHRDPYFFKHAHIVSLAVQDIGSQQPAQRTADDENP